MDDEYALAIQVDNKDDYEDLYKRMKEHNIDWIDGVTPKYFLIELRRHPAYVYLGWVSPSYLTAVWSASFDDDAKFFHWKKGSSIYIGTYTIKAYLPAVGFPKEELEVI